MYTHLIWDFNGTLYNDVPAGIKSANRLLCAHGMPPIATVEEYREQFGFPIIDYYRRLGFDFEKTPFDALAHEWLPYYLEESASADLQPGVLHVLQAAKELELPQIILSASEQTMLEQQVVSLGIRPYFREILGLGNIHAHSKIELALRWKEAHPNANPLFLGDTVHDAEVAGAIRADCILLACGHQSKHILEQTDALAVAEDFQQLLPRLLQSLHADLRQDR